MTMTFGWCCPKCGSVWAPHVSGCEKCNEPEIKTETVFGGQVVFQYCSACGAEVKVFPHVCSARVRT